MDKEGRLKRRRSILGGFSKKDNEPEKEQVNDIREMSKQPSRRKSIIGRIFRPRKQQDDDPKMYMLEDLTDASSIGGSSIVSSSQATAPKRSRSLAELRPKELLKKFKGKLSFGTEVGLNRHNTMDSSRTAGRMSVIRERPISDYSAVQSGEAAFLENSNIFKCKLKMGEEEKMVTVNISDVDYRIEAEPGEPQEETNSGAYSTMIIPVEHVRQIRFTDDKIELEQKEKSTLISLSDFSLNPVTAYYSMIIPWNLNKEAKSSIGPVAAEDEAKETCDCGEVHPGKLVFSAKVAGIAPNPLCNSLFETGPFAIPSVVKEEDGRRKLRTIIVQDCFGDLEGDRKFHVESFRTFEGADHILMRVQFRTLIRSYGHWFQLKIIVCCLRTGPLKLISTLHVFYWLPEDQYPSVARIAREELVPKLISMLENSLKMVVAGLPPVDEDDGNDDDQGPCYTEQCPGFQVMLKAWYTFGLTPKLLEPFGRLKRSAFFKAKELLLAGAVVGLIFVWLQGLYLQYDEKHSGWSKGSYYGFIKRSDAYQTFLVQNIKRRADFINDILNCLNNQ